MVARSHNREHGVYGRLPRLVPNPARNLYRVYLHGNWRLAIAHGFCPRPQLPATMIYALPIATTPRYREPRAAAIIKARDSKITPDCFPRFSTDEPNRASTVPAKSDGPLGLLPGNRNLIKISINRRHREAGPTMMATIKISFNR